MLNQPNKLLARIIFFLGIGFLLAACDGRPSGVLSQDKMANVLTEMHKTDASLAQKGLLYGRYSDKAPYYKFILKKYGITQAEFDSSLVWYTKNPIRFERVYDNVLVQLTSLQTDIKKGKYHKIDSIDQNIIKYNIWNKRTHYTLTKDSTRTKLNFDIPFNNNLLFRDVYILKFLLRIAPEDSSTMQHIVLRINYANGKTDSISKTVYNDSLLRRYTFRFAAKRKLNIKSISGELLGSKLYKGKQNVQLDSISLYREFNAKKQDSLRNEVKKANPTPGFNRKKLNIDSIKNFKKTLNKRVIHPV
jgi:hypothetical protein